MSSNNKILITICARKGSKGVASKNIRNLLGKPLIVHSIEKALSWSKGSCVVVSTDSDEIAEISRAAGANVPFIRPAELATDTAGKLPVLTHALRESERYFNQKFDQVLDLDPTSPIRSLMDIERGYKTFIETGASVCFSVVKARKNPYFNMVEREPSSGKIQLIKTLNQKIVARQAAPSVWDLNASIYFYRRDFLLNDPENLWEGNPEIFEMSPASAFDIDEERDFLIVETLLKQERVTYD